MKPKKIIEKSCPGFKMCIVSTSFPPCSPSCRLHWTVWGRFSLWFWQRGDLVFSDLVSFLSYKSRPFLWLASRCLHVSCLNSWKVCRCWQPNQSLDHLPITPRCQTLARVATPGRRNFQNYWQWFAMNPRLPWTSWRLLKILWTCCLNFNIWFCRAFLQKSNLRHGEWPLN